MLETSSASRSVFNVRYRYIFEPDGSLERLSFDSYLISASHYLVEILPANAKYSINKRIIQILNALSFACSAQIHRTCFRKKTASKTLLKLEKNRLPTLRSRY